MRFPTAKDDALVEAHPKEDSSACRWVSAGSFPNPFSYDAFFSFHGYCVVHHRYGPRAVDGSYAHITGLRVETDMEWC